jgi:hypothetical protein
MTIKPNKDTTARDAEISRRRQKYNRPVLRRASVRVTLFCAGWRSVAINLHK